MNRKEWLTVSVQMVVLVVAVLGIGFMVQEYTRRLYSGNGLDQMSFVSGTEYVPGQEGQLAVMITNVTGDMVAMQYICNYTILFPDKVVFMQGDFLMNTSVGTWYVNFTVPQTEGVYEYESGCVKDGMRVAAAKSFHVSSQGIEAVIAR